MQKEVTLNPGESERVSFLVAPTIQDIYSVQFDGLTGAFEAVEAVPFDSWIYDIDGSCYIEIDEQLVAVGDYNKGLITIDQLNEVIYLYTNNIRNPACPAPECSPEFSTRCDGYDLYTCRFGRWRLTEVNSPSCGYTPPPPTFNPWRYDTNGSGYIEISEQLAATNDYISGLITIDQLNQVIALYQGHVYRW